MQYSFCECAKGPLLIAIDGAGLRHVEFMQGSAPSCRNRNGSGMMPPWPPSSSSLPPTLPAACGADLPLAATGTPFQQAVWQALCDIPYGETVSYLQIAEAIGNPRAVRAVGAANGRNPLSIIVPCHRVIGRSGELTGYGEVSPSSAGCWHWSKRPQTTSR